MPYLIVVQQDHMWVRHTVEPEPFEDLEIAKASAKALSKWPQTTGVFEAKIEDAEEYRLDNRQALALYHAGYEYLPSK